RVKGSWILSLILLLAVGGTAAAQTVKKSTATFSAGGKDISLERFEPAQAGPHPAVVMLHGCDGLEGFGAVLYRGAAEQLAREGYVVLLPHYFERTGTKGGIDAKDISR